MSRNSKNARLVAERKEMSKIRKSGGKGPSKTTPNHNKVRVRWKSTEALQARTAVLNKDTRTAMERFKGKSDD